MNFRVKRPLTLYQVLFSKILFLSVTPMFSALFDFNDTNLHFACLVVILCPLIWNILARLCHKFIPKNTSTTNRHIICYLLAVWIFCFSSYRDYLIRSVIQKQPKLVLSSQYFNVLLVISVILFSIGQLFVLSSFYKLGITGTFLGDYCGILMDKPVTTFPFNVLNNPMYIGSTISFFALSLFYCSPIGVLLTVEIYTFYRFALLFEEPYTKKIYEEKNK